MSSSKSYQVTCAIIFVTAALSLTSVSAASKPPKLKYRYARNVTRLPGTGYYRDLTNAGKLLGQKRSSTGVNSAFLWDPLKRESSYFSVPGNGIISATNAHGDLVGVTTVPANMTLPLFKAQGKLWKKLKLTGIRAPDTLGFTYISDINSKGKFVGQWYGYDGVYYTKYHAFISDPKAHKNTILQFPGASRVYPYSINAAGVVVGEARFKVGIEPDASYYYEAFLYNFKGKKKYQVLSRQGDPSPIYPTSISDAGVVVGGYYDVNGVFTAAFLHPVGTNKWTTIPKAKGKKIIGIQHISPNGKYLLALDEDYDEHLYKRV